MLDEGYIKYQSHWTPGPATHVSAARDLERWRKPLYEARLIGEYEEHGIGYGNLSVLSLIHISEPTRRRLESR